MALIVRGLQTPGGQLLNNSPVLGLPHGAQPRADVVTRLAKSGSLVLWVHSAKSAISHSSNSVDTWWSLYGTNHLTGTTTTRPSTNTRTHNGINVVDFGGAHYLTNASIESYVRPSVFFFVGCLDGTNATSSIIYSTISGVTNGYHFRVGSSTAACALETSRAGIVGLLGGAGTIKIGEPFIACQRLTSSGTYHYINGFPVYNSTTTAGQTGRTIAIGTEKTSGAAASSFWDGWMGELIRFHSDIGESACMRVMEYMNAYWKVY